MCHMCLSYALQACCCKEADMLGGIMHACALGASNKRRGCTHQVLRQPSEFKLNRETGGQCVADQPVQLSMDPHCLWNITQFLQLQTLPSKGLIPPLYGCFYAKNNTDSCLAANHGCVFLRHCCMIKQLGQKVQPCTTSRKYCACRHILEHVPAGIFYTCGIDRRGLCMRHSYYLALTL